MFSAILRSHRVSEACGAVVIPFHYLRLKVHTRYASIPRLQLTFVQLSGLVSEWRHFRLTDEDLQALESQLLQNPQRGVVVSGTGGLRKMRFAPPSRRTGKSGAFRVAYVYFVDREVIVLMSMFAKSDQANLDAAQKAAFKKVIEALK